MPVSRPYRRTCRQFLNGKYFYGDNGEYIEHPKFAQSPEHYVRAFLLIQKDLQELFDYIEPADKNLDCYSYRIHSLLLRACVEVEANLKAILTENGYTKTSGMNMGDYKKVNNSHHLSSYQVKAPIWSGAESLRSPFSSWELGDGLPWYRAYNASKHDRRIEFETATFGHLIDAVTGLLVVLSSQFGRDDFMPGPTLLAIDGPHDDFDGGIGGYFRVRFPTDWPENERYDFDWGKLERELDPFETIDYTKAP